MAVQLFCPSCGSRNLRLLEHVTGKHSPDFYRCEACAHVWWVPKPGADVKHNELDKKS